MDVESFVLALIPVVLLMGLLGVVKYPAHRAGLVTLAVTALLALVGWKMPAFSLLAAVGEGVAVGLWPIMIVIVAAIFSYNLAKKTGAMDKIAAILQAVTTDKRIQVLILAWGFGGFLEAVAGYGTAVAIPASLLAALGFSPLFAAVISLIANTVPTAFGAVGIPVSTLASMTGLDATLLSGHVAAQLTPFIILIPFVLVIMTGGGVRALRGVMGITLASGVAFALPQYLAARYLGPELPALLGALCSLGVTILLALRRSAERRTRFTWRYQWEAWRLYGLILLLILAASPLCPPLYHTLGDVTSTVRFLPQGDPVKFKWIATPGMLIILATVLAGRLAGLSLRQSGAVFAATARQLAASFVTVLSIVALAKVMVYAGMIADLAAGLAALTGPVFPYISPLIGMLGTFVTGSDTSSNILFGNLQKEIAQSLQISPAWLAAANTAGATAGKMISPQSIAVATSATGLVGMEGRIFTRTLAFCLVYVLLLGLAVGVGAFPPE